MKYIINAENIKIEEKAIYTIAKNAQGGMRDALSLLDQALSYSENNVTEADVHEITGTVSEEHLTDIVGRILLSDTKGVIKLLDNLISLGKEPLRLIENMIFYFRDLFLIRKMNVVDEQLIINHGEKTVEMAQRFSDRQLVDIIGLLNNTQYEMRKTNLPRVFIELAVFEITNLLNVDKTEVKDEAEAEVQEQELPVEEPANHEIENEITEITEKKYIDVALIENILNNASKEKKLNLVLQWQSLYSRDITQASIVQLLLDGQVEAVSNNNQIILSYEYETVCATLYDKEIYDKATTILADYFNERYEIVPLPRKIWIEKREEFIEQFKRKIKYPKLSPITEPIMIKRQVNKYEYEPEFVKTAVNLFGDEIVKIK